MQAEGFWGIRRLSSRPTTRFDAAVKAHPKDANLRVRWGRMYLERWQPADAAGLCSTEALEIDEELRAGVAWAGAGRGRRIRRQSGRAGASER